MQSHTGPASSGDRRDFSPAQVAIWTSARLKGTSSVIYLTLKQSRWVNPLRIPHPPHQVKSLSRSLLNAKKRLISLLLDYKQAAALGLVLSSTRRITIIFFSPQVSSFTDVTFFKRFWELHLHHAGAAEMLRACNAAHLTCAQLVWGTKQAKNK